jgi:hypothetical protein
MCALGNTGLKSLRHLRAQCFGLGHRVDGGLAIDLHQRLHTLGITPGGV